MRLSAIGYQNRISYSGNTEVNNIKTVAEPKQNENMKKAVKYTALAVAGLTLVALFAEKGKPLGKLFKGFGKNADKQSGEKVEEVVPEVLDYDYFGQRIAYRKKAKMQPPRSIVIDERGNILAQHQKATPISDFFDGINKQREKSKAEGVFDIVVDVLDTLAGIY